MDSVTVVRAGRSRSGCWLFLACRCMHLHSLSWVHAGGGRGSSLILFHALSLWGHKLFHVSTPLLACLPLIRPISKSRDLAPGLKTKKTLLLVTCQDGWFCLLDEPMVLLTWMRSLFTVILLFSAIYPIVMKQFELSYDVYYLWLVLPWYVFLYPFTI